MKNNKGNKIKLSLKKIRIAKIDDPTMIIGGTGDSIQYTDLCNDNTELCVGQTDGCTGSVNHTNCNSHPTINPIVFTRIMC